MTDETSNFKKTKKLTDFFWADYWVDQLSGAPKREPHKQPSNVNLLFIFTNKKIKILCTSYSLTKLVLGWGGGGEGTKHFIWVSPTKLTS